MCITWPLVREVFECLSVVQAVERMLYGTVPPNALTRGPASPSPVGARAPVISKHVLPEIFQTMLGSGEQKVALYRPS